MVRRALDASPVVVLMGARQTGKSTLVQSESFLRDRPYLTLDDYDVCDRARTAPDDLVQSHPRLTIDEVQREPDLLLAIKRAVDEERPRRNGRFVLTASANLLLMHRVSETLAGRATYVHLWPLTRGERQGKGTAGVWTGLLSTPVSEWPALIESRPSGAADWQTEARLGGYPTPAVDLKDETARAMWFDGYVRTYLERDLQSMASITNLVAFRRLMRVASRQLGKVVRQTALGRKTRIPRVTVQRYLNLLEMSFQLVRLQPYTVNRSKRLIKSPKLYWSDAALAWWLNGSREPSGALLETQILSDLLAWRDSQVPAPEVLFWRTTTELEVDFVVEAAGRLLPIEVKATERPGYAHTRGLRAFRQEYPRESTGGLLLHGGGHTLWIAKGILAVPWWRIL